MQGHTLFIIGSLIYPSHSFGIDTSVPPMRRIERPDKSPSNTWRKFMRRLSGKPHHHILLNS